MWIRVPYARLYTEILRGRDDAKRTVDVLRKRFEELENDEYKAVSKNKKEVQILLLIFRLPNSSNKITPKKKNS